MLLTDKYLVDAFNACDERTYLNGEGACDTIYIGGSYAYGLNDENSDVDVRAIACRSAQDILLGRDFDTKQYADPDIVVYSLDKFISLITACNPNIIEFCGLTPTNHDLIGPVGYQIQALTPLILSKQAAKTFKGFAVSQKLRLEGKRHNQGKPTQKRIAKLQCHYVRLCRMGTELLTDHVVNTDRKLAGDADELMHIKHGAYTKPEGDIYVPTDDWEALATNELARLEAAENTTDLPEHADTKALASLLMETNCATIMRAADMIQHGQRRK